MSERAALWDRLVAGGIAEGAPPSGAEVGRPWYIKTMVGIAAWIASLFLDGFVGVALPHMSGSVNAVLGVCVCAAAVAALRIARGGVFVTQLAIATSLAGQVFVALGLLEHHGESGGAWLILAAFEILLVIAAPEAIHRALSTIAAAIAVRVAMGLLDVAALFPAMLAVTMIAVFLRGTRLDAFGSWPAPVASGLAVTVLLLVPLSLADGQLFRSVLADTHRALPPWAGAAALAAAFVAATALLLRGAGVAVGTRTWFFATMGALAISIAAWPVPGVILALVVLLFAFAQGRLFLQGLAVLSLLAALVYYYYALETTLLAKSGALFASGLVLLCAYGLVHVLYPAERAHA